MSGGKQATDVAWSYDGGGTPYVPSPLLYGDKIYFLSVNRAILSCVNARTGEKHYNEKRLEGLDGVYASIVGARDRVFFVEALRFHCATDHQTLRGPRAIKTYPSISPRGGLDRIYYRGGLRLLWAYRCRHAIARVASDHRPLIAEFELH